MQEQDKIRMVEYETRYHAAFRSLNEEWISTYFEMEEADYKVLDNPQANILDKGGKIFVALYNNEAVGVCALIKMEDASYDFELAKMAVSPKAQGMGVGALLGQAVLTAAKALGASRIFLESNTKLKPAINLYRKLGFKEIVGRPAHYKRVDIQMELVL